MDELASPRRLSFKRVATLILVGLAMFVSGFGLRALMETSSQSYQLLSPLAQKTPEPPNPYPAYTFAALRALPLTAGAISILRPIGEPQPSFQSFLVSWEVPNLEANRRDRVTGQLNLPNGPGQYPVILMLRGYVDRDGYQTGIGTKNAAAEFAKNGYVTIAPDFLGYGGSDAESGDILISRFARPLTVLQLLKNVDSLRLEISPEGTGEAVLLNPQLVGRTIDSSRLGLWAHSNGGQIALSVLEISSRVIPTTLWAPVSQPFPYSVLFYSNEQADGGKYLRSQLANFEFTLNNDPAAFSVLTEPSRILAPLQIHQGKADDAVPFAWSESLVDKLQDATVSAQLYLYPTADHNLQPDWRTAVQRDLQFFAKYLKK